MTDMNLIIDGYNIAFRSHHIYDVKQGLKTSDGLPTGIVYGFLKSLLKWKDKFPHHRMIVVWDTPGGKEERREIFADYKADRERNSDTIDVTECDVVGSSDDDGEEEVQMMSLFAFQVRCLKTFLEAIGVDQAQAPKSEADDVIHNLVTGPLSDHSNIILSSDRDLLQLVTRSTVLQTPGGKTYDPDLVKEEYHGIEPKHFLAYRALSGDKSDGLPGLPYFRRKVIARLVSEYDGDLDSIYSSLDDEDLTEKEHEKLVSFEKQAHINQQVMSFREREYRIVEGSQDDNRTEELCDTFEIESIRSDLLEFNSTQGFVRFSHG